MQAAVQVTKPTVSVLVDKLSEKGYVRRVHSDQDRRVIHLQIDKKGTKIGALREIAHKKLAGMIRAGLNEEETVILTRLLRKIVRPE
jgi:DNA-binding MarR family transcriptional regulator